MRIVFEEGLGVAEAKVLADYGVDLRRGYARRHDLAHQLMRLPDTDAGLSHQGDFTIRFKLNHGSYEGDRLYGPAILAGQQRCSDPGWVGYIARSKHFSNLINRVN
jgi:hypothetical protein